MLYIGKQILVISYNKFLCYFPKGMSLLFLFLGECLLIHQMLHSLWCDWHFHPKGDTQWLSERLLWDKEKTWRKTIKDQNKYKITIVSLSSSRAFQWQVYISYGAKLLVSDETRLILFSLPVGCVWVWCNLHVKWMFAYILLVCEYKIGELLFYTCKLYS